MKNKKGVSVAISSAKGGVGKTVNTIALAGIFEQLEKKILVIDFDLYNGDIITYANKRPKKDIFDLSLDMDNLEYKNIKNYITKFDNNIDILAAPIDPRNASKINIANIPDIINKATLNYDVVLVDTNHALNDITLSVLQTVDKILLLTTNDPLDIKNLRTLIAILNEYEYDNYKIILNNSRDPYKDYFSMFDIKKILNHNIDYTLSIELYLKDIEKYIMDGIIITLDKKFSDYFMKDYRTYLVIATDILGGNENE